MAVNPFKTPFFEAVDALKARGRNLVPTASWRDLTPAEHLTSFTVGKSEGFDILGDIHAALVIAKNEGETFRMFYRRIEPVLKAKGWWGKQPEDGIGDPAEFDKRLETIYNVNLRMAGAAGRWAQVMRAVDQGADIYLRYCPVLDNRTRPEHRAWGDIVLPWDHPFWDTRYPPNGKDCRCSVMVIDRHHLERHGFAITPDEVIPDFGWERHSFLRRGQLVTEEVPRGVEPGFAYHFGAGAF